MSHVIQAELYDKNSLKIRPVVRFFDDEHQSITRLVQWYRRMDWLHELVVKYGFPALVWQGVGRWLACKRSDIRQDLLRVVIARLRYLVHAEEDIACERRDYSFRMARPEKILRLLEEARNAGHVWVFIFDTDDLLQTDDLTMIANVM